MESAVWHAKHPVHCWSKPYLSQMQETDVERLLIADAFVCYVTAAASRVKHPSAWLELLATGMVQKGEIDGRYNGTLVHHDQSSRPRTLKGSGRQGLESKSGATL